MKTSLMNSVRYEDLDITPSQEKDISPKHINIVKIFQSCVRYRHYMQ